MRLIDAGALRAWLVKAGRFLKLQDDKRTASHAIGKVIDHVDKIPAVDAVPVVRCKDCKYYKPDEYECGCDFAGGATVCKSWRFLQLRPAQEPICGRAQYGTICRGRQNRGPK